jgi:hypothetical protein
MELTEREEKTLREMRVADAQASIDLLERWLRATESERLAMLEAGRRMSLKMASSILMKDPGPEVVEVKG